MNLSVIVPVFNEEATVKHCLQRLVKRKEVSQIIIVNDGSTDRSEREIKTVKDRRIEYYLKANGGKGSAIRFALPKVTGDYVLIQDADLEYDPDDIPALLEPIKKGKAKVVYGSRFLGPHLNLLFWHRVGNAWLNFMINILYNTTLSDMETCYKVVPASLLKSLDLQSKSFEIEPEITCKLLRRGERIYEVPISYVGRDQSQGKKIRWTDGLVAMGWILKLRFFL